MVVSVPSCRLACSVLQDDSLGCGGQLGACCICIGPQRLPLEMGWEPAQELGLWVQSSVVCLHS